MFFFYSFTTDQQASTLTFSHFFFPPIFSFILQILSSVFCLLLGGEGKNQNQKKPMKEKNLVRKILKGFIMSQCFQFTLHISLSPEGVNTAY